MAYAIDITPEQLRNIGQHHLADLVERRRALLEPETSAEGRNDMESELETYILEAPGLTQGNRTVLVSVALGLLRGQPADSIPA